MIPKYASWPPEVNLLDSNFINLFMFNIHYHIQPLWEGCTSSHSLVGLVATKSHACYLPGGPGSNPAGFKFQLLFRISSRCLCVCRNVNIYIYI